MPQEDIRIGMLIKDLHEARLCLMAMKETGKQAMDLKVPSEEQVQALISLEKSIRAVALAHDIILTMAKRVQGEKLIKEVTGANGNREGGTIQ